MRTFTYQTWGGKHVTVEADRVMFFAGHVVFLTGQELTIPFLVLAESNANVHNLREVEAE